MLQQRTLEGPVPLQLLPRGLANCEGIRGEAGRLLTAILCLA